MVKAGLCSVHAKNKKGRWVFVGYVIWRPGAAPFKKGQAHAWPICKVEME
jgi:hypothetical protein